MARNKAKPKVTGTHEPLLVNTVSFKYIATISAFSIFKLQAGLGTQVIGVNSSWLKAVTEAIKMEHSELVL